MDIPVIKPDDITIVCLFAEEKGHLNTPCKSGDLCTDADSTCASTKICLCEETHYLIDDTCCMLSSPIF